MSLGILENFEDVHLKDNDFSLSLSQVYSDINTICLKYILRDFVELIHAVIDVLQIGIDIRPSVFGCSNGWPVVRRRGLKLWGGL